MPAVGQLHYNIAPVEDAKDIYEFLVLIAFLVLTKKQLYHDVNPPGDSDYSCHMLHEFKQLAHYHKWKEKVHYNAGPFLETGDLQQIPSLQEGELVPSLQEEEFVLVSEDPVHHASPVKADMQGEETSRYYNVFLYKPLGQEQDNLFVPMPFCVLRIYTAPVRLYIMEPFISPFPFVGYRDKLRPFPFVGNRVKFFKFHASPTATKKMFEPLVPFHKMALIWELFAMKGEKMMVTSLRSKLTSTDSSSLSFPSVGKPESMPWRVPWSMP